MSTTIVKADLGRIPGFVCVLNDIVYLVVNSQMGFSGEPSRPERGDCLIVHLGRTEGRRR